MTPTDRPARPEDVDEICATLPGTEFGTTWGDVPTWKVLAGEKGRGFVLYRHPHKTATDPETGEVWDDVLVVVTPDMGTKQSLVEDPATPFFTVDHFRTSTSVLVRLSRLGEISRDELAEVITEAWATRAPRRLVKEHFADG